MGAEKFSEKKTLLFVDACVRGKGISRTRELCDAFLEALGDKYEVIHLDLDAADIMPMNNRRLKHRNDLISAKELDNPLFDYSHQFAKADAILIGAPYWDWAFPACLKAYLERISVDGITFHYEGSECIGNCHAKWAVYLSTAGGMCAGHNMGADYIEEVFKNYGISNFKSLTAEALDIWESDAADIMKESLYKVQNLAIEYL